MCNFFVVFPLLAVSLSLFIWSRFPLWLSMLIYFLSHPAFVYSPNIAYSFSPQFSTRHTSTYSSLGIINAICIHFLVSLFSSHIPIFLLSICVSSPHIHLLYFTFSSHLAAVLSTCYSLHVLKRHLWIFLVLLVCSFHIRLLHLHSPSPTCYSPHTAILPNYYSPLVS